MRSEPGRARLAAEVVVAYLRAARELRRAPIEDVVARLRRGPATVAIGRGEEAEARRLGYIVVRVMRRLPGDTRCLRRSLVLVQLLAHRGIDSEMVIGARGGPDFLAHAWVEHAGRPLLDPGDGTFARFVTL
jgi:hypothetical protein